MKFSSVLRSSAIALQSIVSVSAVVVNPLPAPRNITWGNSGSIEISPSLSLNLGNASEIVSQAFERTWERVVDLKWYPAAIEQPLASYVTTPYRKRDVSGVVVSRINIDIEDVDIPLQLGVDESYKLDVESGSGEISIASATTWGALHALTTFQQLIIYQNGSFILEEPVSIWDAPLYPHRGIMIDSGRNFLQKKKILEQIEAMSLCKLNSLHWHIDDSQSWPIEIIKYPEMTEDAYSAREVYTQQDIKDVVAYGKVRGVRIIPEIDMPGHSRAGWQKVNPEIVSCADIFWTESAVEPAPGQLNPVNNDTYKIVQDVYDELSALFDDNIFHVGADELQETCYNFSTSVREWYAEDESRTISDLLQLWVDKTEPIFMNTPDRRLTMWEDVVMTTHARNVSKNVILQSWDVASNVKNLTSQGYDVIVSSYLHFYLDCGFSGFVTNDPRYIDVPANDDFNENNAGSWCGPYKSWQRIYDYDFTQNLTETEKSHVLGAEVCLWSEQVDSAVITQKIWPRTAALAESTWSGNKNAEGYFRTNFVSQRIFNFREYLVAIGIDASPLVPKFCLQNPHACDLYQNQTILFEYDA
ncbi:beta-hexosaminidase [[Candida] railenensis]|uniref:Beta-hexosaminidase n=1 Tax=[Candida] railenensis TaxID=45579 RepID=A0A9P0VZ07_9ASCO|nr:beta-hexosaminidase [[Candida] railenensis]